MSFIAIHIFENGTTQLVEKEYNNTKSNSSIPTLTQLVDNIYSKKPIDLDIPNEYKSISIYDNGFAQYVALNSKNIFKVDYAELDEALVNSVIAEIKA